MRSAAADAPSVLLVLIDDVGFGWPSVNGGLVRMPTAERLHQRGLSYRAVRQGWTEAPFFRVGRAGEELRMLDGRDEADVADPTTTSTIARLAGELRTNRHLRREAESMWLYVAIVLLSALSIFDDDHPPAQGDIFLLEVGTTAGLVLAHGFASWVATRVVSGPAEDVDSWDMLWVQLGGALAVAGLSIVAVAVAPTSLELPVARVTVAVAIAALVYAESRVGRSPRRAAVYGLLALAAGVTVALLKSLLTH